MNGACIFNEHNCVGRYCIVLLMFVHHYYVLCSVMQNVNIVLLIFSVPLNVSFVETVYTVVERDEMVEVCVNLTMPDADIFENTVNVEVFVDDNSIYIPPNARIASKLSNQLPHVHNNAPCMYQHTISLP